MIARKLHSTFLALFLITFIAICFAAALLSHFLAWDVYGTLVLFLGLLPLLNAPFDWVSLGVTRWLLRWGIRKGQWWPLLLSLLDVVAAVVVIVGLTVVLVIGVQAFNIAAESGGGGVVLLLDTLFQGIAKAPGEPEYWWVYALLLSTQIPSLINLIIGGAALLRSIPGATDWIYRRLPMNQSVLASDRGLIAAALTVNWIVAVGLGVLAEVGLLWGMLGYLMPKFGWTLLTLAESVAGLGLPQRLVGG